jgi:hypothetical protein
VQVADLNQRLGILMAHDCPHDPGKSEIINRTSTTSASTTNSDESTTELTGPLSLNIEKMMIAGRKDFAPNRTRLSRVSSESTMPVAGPARATDGSDNDPIASHGRISSRHS